MYVDASACRNERQIAVRVLAAYTGTEVCGVPESVILGHVARRLSWARDRHITITGIKPGLQPSALLGALEAGGADTSLQYAPGKDRRLPSTRAMEGEVLRLLDHGPLTFGKVLASWSLERKPTPSTLRRLVVKMAQKGALIRDITIGGMGGSRSLLVRYESRPA